LPAHPYPLNDIEFQAELLTDRRGERSYGSRLNVKKLRAAALRERECAIASKRAARIAPRFRPALPSGGNRRSVFLGRKHNGLRIRQFTRRLDFLLWCPGELLRDFLRRNERRLWRGTGQPYDFVRGVRGIEPTGNVSSQVIDRSAPPDTEARGKGDRNERNPSTGAH
jgi:hypothetical protein